MKETCRVWESHIKKACHARSGNISTYIHKYISIHIYIYIYLHICIYTCIYIWRRTAAQESHINESCNTQAHINESCPTQSSIGIRDQALHTFRYVQKDRLNYTSLLQNIVSCIGLFCKRDLYFCRSYEPTPTHISIRDQALRTFRCDPCAAFWSPCLWKRYVVLISE